MDKDSKYSLPYVYFHMTVHFAEHVFSKTFVEIITDSPRTLHTICASTVTETFHRMKYCQIFSTEEPANLLTKSA